MNTEENAITLVNIFPVEPLSQQKLVDVLTRTTQESMRYQPGFLSAHLYRGLKGNYVANYVQWRSREDFDRMLQKPEVQQHIALVHAVATGNPQLYELCNVTTGMLSAEHDIVVLKPWEQCFEVCSALDRWPEFMPAVRQAKVIRQTDKDQEIEITAEFGDQVVTWRSRRELLPELKMIRFWSLTPRYPIKALAGEWSFAPANGEGTRVRVSHQFEVVDPAQEAAARAGISRNMIGDLQGMKTYMEANL
jgi:ribosome-associated toxin RatA of RatAB toxin-antitoxin module/quinol monooxygenase YgiN